VRQHEAADPHEEESLRAGGLALGDEIGRGSSGVVFRGRHLLLDRPVALKRIVTGANADPQGERRLRTEIAALVRLEHPAVVRLLDVKRTGPALWLVMEYVDGPALQAVLTRRRGVLAPADALAVLEQLASGLGHLARHGVVHRDLKPANVFLCHPSRCKLGDFGIALLDAAGAGATADPAPVAAWVTRPGTVLGTPSYLSPEQAEGRQATTASDVYSLGVVAYELLVGRVPFPFRGNLLAVLASHAAEAPPPPRSVRPDLSMEVEEALLAPLEKDPARRPASAADFWQRLDTAAGAMWPDWRRQADLDALVATRSSAPGVPPAAVVDGASTWAGTVEQADMLAGVAALVGAVARPQEAASAASPAAVPPARSHAPRRPWRRRRLRRARWWAVLVTVFVLAAGASFLATHALSGGAPAQLRVQSVSLSSHAVRGVACGSVAVLAQIRLGGGAGTLQYDWSTPEGSSPGNTQVAVGTRAVTLEHRFTLRTSRETIRLQLSSPAGRRDTSLPVSAAC
jgi:hypothetical protein